MPTVSLKETAHHVQALQRFSLQQDDSDLVSLLAKVQKKIEQSTLERKGLFASSQLLTIFFSNKG